MKNLFTKNRKAILAFCMAFFLLGGNVMAQTPIAAWNFTGIGNSDTPGNGRTFTATTFDANLVSSGGASDITRGAGAVWSTGANSFRTTGFRSDIPISTANTNFFQVTLTAEAGYEISLSTIDARLNGTQTFVGTAGVSNQFAYSLDGTNFTLIGSPQVLTGTVLPLDMSQIDLTSIAGLQNVAAGTTITIRFYASGQTITGGWGFFSGSGAGSTNGLAIGGTVAREVGALPRVTPPVISPTSRNVFEEYVTVTITHPDDAVIYFTKTGDDFPTNWSRYTEPFPVSSTTTVRAIALGVEGETTNSIPVSVTYTFPVEVANIAEFLDLGVGTIAKITEPITVVTQQGRNIFVQDASGWLWIDWENPTYAYKNGDQITGAIGTRAIQNNMPRLNTFASVGLSAGEYGTPVAPETIAPEDLVNTDINRFVAFENVKIAQDITFLSSGAAQDGRIVANTSMGTMIIRNAYQFALGNFNAGDIVNAVGIVSIFNNNLQLNLLSIEMVTPALTPEGMIAHWGGFTSSNNGNFLATRGTAANTGIAVLTRGDGNARTSYTAGSAATSGFATSGFWAVDRYWIATFSTIGIEENLTVSSTQRGTGTSPRNFKLQYRIGSTDEWKDVENGAIVVADNITSGVLTDLLLPLEMSNKEEVSLRWIVSGNTNINNGTLTADGAAAAVNSLRATIRVAPPTIIVDGCDNLKPAAPDDEVHFTLCFGKSLGINRTLSISGINLPETPTVGLVDGDCSHPGAFRIIDNEIRSMRSGSTGGALEVEIEFTPMESEAEHTSTLSISSGDTEMLIGLVAMSELFDTTDTPEVIITHFIYARDRQVHFSATVGETVQIHNVLGQLIYQGTVAEGRNSVAVSPGIVLVRIGDVVNKIVVR